MKLLAPLILFVFILLACGPKGHLTRGIASLPHAGLTDSLPIAHEVDGKLRSFHYYFVLQLLYQKKPQKALASKVQFQELEAELLKVWTTTQSEQNRLQLQAAIERYGDESPVARYTMKQLLSRLQKEDGPLFHPGARDIEREYLRLKGLDDFEVHEKNIEHLSHKLDVKRQGHILKV